MLVDLVGEIEVEEDLGLINRLESLELVKPMKMPLVGSPERVVHTPNYLPFYPLVKVPHKKKVQWQP